MLSCAQVACIAREPSCIPLDLDCVLPAPRLAGCGDLPESCHGVGAATWVIFGGLLPGPPVGCRQGAGGLAWRGPVEWVAAWDAAAGAVC